MLKSFATVCFISLVCVWVRVCVCVLGGGRPDAEDPAYPRLHTQTAAGEEEVTGSGARGHQVRPSSLCSLCWPVGGATSLITNRLLLQRRPHDSAGGRDRAGGVLQGAGGHRLRQIPRRFHLLAVTSPPPPPPARAAEVRGQRGIRTCEVLLVPVAQGQYTLIAAAPPRRGRGLTTTVCRSEHRHCPAWGLDPTHHHHHTPPPPRSDPRRPSYSSAKRHSTCKYET